MSAIDRATGDSMAMASTTNVTASTPLAGSEDRTVTIPLEITVRITDGVPAAERVIAGSGRRAATVADPTEYTCDRLAVLLRWHSEHAVSLHERHRNRVIAGKQGNRNPLVDHPEWAKRIDWTNGLR